MGTSASGLRDGDSSPGFLKSPIFHMAAISAVSAAVLLSYGLNWQPIVEDCAYFIYMAQVVRRGGSLYGDTTFGYTPYGPLLSAASMYLGEIFGLPSYLAPRYLSLVVTAVNSCLLYAVARNASGSRLTGVLSGLTLSGFGYLSILSAANLEPKVMVVFSMLIAMLALQKKNWVITGFGSALACMFWQPAVVIALTMFIIIACQGREKSLPRLAKFSAGIFLGTLPALLYLTVCGEWQNFIYMSIVRRTVTDFTKTNLFATDWAYRAFKGSKSESFILVFALIGFLWFIIKNFVRKKTGTVNESIDTNNGGLFLLVLAWSLFNSVVFDALHDFIPMLPLISYWSSTVVSRLVKGAGTALKTLTGLPVIKPAITLAGCALLSIFLFRDIASYKLPFTLSKEKSLVENVLGRSNGIPRFIALNAEEFYVLTDTQSPLRYTRMAWWVDRLIEKFEPGGSEGFIRRLFESPPPLFVIRRKGKKSTVLERIEDELLSGYNLTVYDLRQDYGMAFQFQPLSYPFAWNLRVYRR